MATSVAPTGTGLVATSEAPATVEARFDYGCQPRSSFCSELTCTFDGGASTSTAGAINGFQWYFRRYLAEDRESETGSMTGKRVTYTYRNTRCRNYTYYATLEVTDSAGNKDLHTEQVNPSRRMDFPTENQGPIADFTVACTFLQCRFDGSASTDADGTIVSYDWRFGDGDTGGGSIVDHAYVAAGSYAVYLTVTDDDGAMHQRAKTVTVSAEPPPGFNLTASAVEVRGGYQVTHLSWTGATASNVDVYRNSALILTTPNDGFHADNTGQRGPATYTYRICNTGTTTCSNLVTVVFQ